MLFKQHPLSAAFPAMSPEEFQELKDSIENMGVQNPITLLDGMVIDGWHRASACRGRCRKRNLKYVKLGKLIEAMA